MVIDKNGTSHECSCTVLGHVATFAFVGTVPSSSLFDSFSVETDDGETIGEFEGFETVYRTFSDGFSLSDDESTFNPDIPTENAPDNYESAFDVINSVIDDLEDGTSTKVGTISTNKLNVTSIFASDIDATGSIKGNMYLKNGLWIKRHEQDEEYASNPYVKAMYASYGAEYATELAVPVYMHFENDIELDGTIYGGVSSSSASWTGSVCNINGTLYRFGPIAWFTGGCSFTGSLASGSSTTLSPSRLAVYPSNTVLSFASAGKNYLCQVAIAANGTVTIANRGANGYSSGFSQTINFFYMGS